MKNKIKEYINLSIDMKKKLLEDSEIISNIEELAVKCLESLKDGGKIILAGNGGSFGDAQHISAEFTSRFLFEIFSSHPLFCLELYLTNALTL